ncbi:gp33 family protein [Immundisolibacter sp.]
MEHVPSNSEVYEISSLAHLQIKRQERVNELEVMLKEATEALRKVQEIDLPNAMAQAGVQSITLPTGEKITIKEDVYASIPKDERYNEALDWLRSRGFGDLIKNEVKVVFGRGEEDSAKALVAELNVNGWRNYSVSEGVHASTLKAFMREQLAKGVDIPMELFGATPVTKAIIK